METSDNKHKKRKFIFGGILAAAIGVCALFLCVGVVKINGNSMQPNLKHGDIILYNRVFGAADYGDVIVFKREDQRYIKRVFGKPGDSVKITDNGVLLVNGTPLIIENLTVLGMTSGGLAADELVLAENQYFVLGDNRVLSLDSRNEEMGMVDKSEILGVYFLGGNSKK